MADTQVINPSAYPIATSLVSPERRATAVAVMKFLLRPSSGPNLRLLAKTTGFGVMLRTGPDVWSSPWRRPLLSGWIFSPFLVLRGEQ